MGKDRLRKSSCEEVRLHQMQVVLQRMVYILFLKYEPGSDPIFKSWPWFGESH